MVGRAGGPSRLPAAARPLHHQAEIEDLAEIYVLREILEERGRVRLSGMNELWAQPTQFVLDSSE
jgi:hypothetical protein